MIQGCAKFDNNVKAEDESGKGLGCVTRVCTGVCSAGIRLGAKDRGTVWATVGDGFLEAWYEPTLCGLEKAVFKITERDTVCTVGLLSD